MNPGNTLAKIISTLHDPDGRIAIEGFYDDVIEWEEETRAAIQALPFDDSELLRETGASGLDGETGFSTLERLWIRPTCDVNGLLCGYTGEGAKTVLPAKAMAKVSFRLVPDQNPDRVHELLEAHIRRVAPPEVDVSVIDLHGGRPWKAELEGAFFEAAQRSLDKLIRAGVINSDLATSLINDGNYTKIVVRSLMDMTKAWNKAILSDNEVEDILSLEPEEIEAIARQVH